MPLASVVPASAPQNTRGAREAVEAISRVRRGLWADDRCRRAPGARLAGDRDGKGIVIKRLEFPLPGDREPPHLVPLAGRVRVHGYGRAKVLAVGNCLFAVGENLEIYGLGRGCKEHERDKARNREKCRISLIYFLEALALLKKIKARMNDLRDDHRSGCFRHSL